MQQEHRRLAAILAADVAGYSRLMATDESGTLARLNRLRSEVIEPKIAQFHGRIVGSAGDSLLVEFASALNAVQCAIETQEELADRNANLPEDRRMAFRMGVNLGDVIPERDTIHGDGVNIAARLEKLARPGSVCIARNIYEQVKSKLAYTYTDLGEQRMHNIPEPVHAFQVGPANTTVNTPPGISAKNMQALPDRPSIAVLPFTNMSGDAEQEFFSDGITEDIITELSRFRSLFVIARHSTFAYKGRALNLKDVGRDLGVRYVAEGSVRRAGNRVRVTVQLIDAQTGSHLWAERYDRELEDIFAVQDEIARRIVTSLVPRLEAEALDSAKRKPPEDMRVYDCYLRAKSLVDMPRGIADLEQAREYCDRAIQLDPSFARAHAYKALSYVLESNLLLAENVEERRLRALACAEAAVALDPMDEVSHWSLGEAALQDRQFDRARRHMARARELNPNDADVLAVSGYVDALTGDPEAGLRHMEMALERNPLKLSWYNWLRGAILIMSGRFEDALRDYSLYSPPNASILRWRIVALVQLGRFDEARADMKTLQVIRPGTTVADIRESFSYTLVPQQYLDRLHQAGLPD